MAKVSAGLLLYRRGEGAWQVLLVHPGGPFFAKKDVGAWTIPKGEPLPEEELLAAARREFQEETGFSPDGPFLPLSPIKQKGGKLVHAWAAEGDFDVAELHSNSFSIEWPPRTGRQQNFPEIDRAEFFTLAEASEKINPGQVALLREIGEILEEIG